MPKLVAFYLREFSVRSDGEPSWLYKFIFCLCLPFFSPTFNRARLIALAIAECTNSQGQIFRLLEKITGATAHVGEVSDDYFASYDGTDPTTDFTYNTDTETSGVTFSIGTNYEQINVRLNGASESEVAAYLQLLIPFYVEIQIVYKP